MDMSLERDGGVIGTLFQQIINDMKVSTNRFNYSTSYMPLSSFCFFTASFPLVVDCINQIGLPHFVNRRIDFNFFPSFAVKPWSE